MTSRLITGEHRLNVENFGDTISEQSFHLTPACYCEPLLSSRYQKALRTPRHCEEHSDVAIHAESVKAVKDVSPGCWKNGRFTGG